MDRLEDAAPVRGQPRLLDPVRNVIRRLHYSIRTEHAYIDWIRRFILFHGKRHPAEMGVPRPNVTKRSSQHINPLDQ